MTGFASPNPSDSSVCGFCGRTEDGTIQLVDGDRIVRVDTCDPCQDRVARPPDHECGVCGDKATPDVDSSDRRVTTCDSCVTDIRNWGSAVLSRPRGRGNT